MYKWSLIKEIIVQKHKLRDLFTSKILNYGKRFISIGHLCF